jgi:L,D-peptidoglycan transpeptidase YkuD (ErfK/YbiS/YcfS/YnhG family)
MVADGGQRPYRLKLERTGSTLRRRIASTTTSAPPTSSAAPQTSAESSTPTSSNCPANLADDLAATGGSTQLVTVNSPSYPSTYALLTTWQRRGDCWVRLEGPWTARLGYSGIHNYKVEGDGSTPAGRFGIGPVIYGIAPNPGTKETYHQLVCGDWWDEDPSSPEYNTFQYVRCGTTPSWGGGDSEALWTETTAYQSFAFIEYNTSPVIPGRGSAIFLHDNVGGPTDGCVSLPPAELDTVLDWFLAADSPEIVIGTDGEIQGF